MYTRQVDWAAFVSRQPTAELYAMLEEYRTHPRRREAFPRGWRRMIDGELALRRCVLAELIR